MNHWNYTASKLFNNANRFIEAYHAVLQPICKETGLPPMAVNILMFIANNPESNTAGDICRCRGLKTGIVSVYVDRLVNEGLLLRQAVQGDRRKTQLSCTAAANGLMDKGCELQKRFAQRLLAGVSSADIEIFHHCLAVLGSNINEIRKNGLSTKE